MVVILRPNLLGRELNLLSKEVKKVIIIGAGGTGSILIPQAARYLRSQKFQGEFILIDGDSYSEGNAERQTFAMSKVGMNKAKYQAMAVSSQLPDFGDRVTFVDKYIGEADIEDLVEENCIVINCADNNAIRKLVEDRVMGLKNAAHICCGNELRDGQVQLFLRNNGKNLTPSIYEGSPQFNSLTDDRSKMNCEAISALPSGGQLIAANMMCATLALNFLIQLTFGAKIHKSGTYIPTSFVQFDSYTNGFNRKQLMPLEQD